MPSKNQKGYSLQETVFAMYTCNDGFPTNGSKVSKGRPFIVDIGVL